MRHITCDVTLGARLRHPATRRPSYPVRMPVGVLREQECVAPYKKDFRHGVLTAVSSTLKGRDCPHSIPKCVVVDRLKPVDGVPGSHQSHATAVLVDGILKLVIGYVSATSEVSQRLTNGTEVGVIGSCEVVNDGLVGLVSCRYLRDAIQLDA